MNIEHSFDAKPITIERGFIHQEKEIDELDSSFAAGFMWILFAT